MVKRYDTAPHRVVMCKIRFAWVDKWIKEHINQNMHEEQVLLKRVPVVSGGRVE